MSASKNAESMAQQGEFHSRRPGSEPMTTKGHAPGVKVGNDAYPEFSAEVHTPGTAPPENTYRPNTESTIPGQALNPQMEASVRTNASDTIPGATSADVHQGYGHPGSGQTSSDLHGQKKKERSGVEGVGASGTDPVRERRPDIAVEPDARGKTKNAESWPGAEDRYSATAEEVASERR